MLYGLQILGRPHPSRSLPSWVPGSSLAYSAPLLSMLSEVPPGANRAPFHSYNVFPSVGTCLLVTNVAFFRSRLSLSAQPQIPIRATKKRFFERSIRSPGSDQLSFLTGRQPFGKS